ncbi:hypothetical protein [Chamaesiphon polymorphus]|uniref:Uncharacterized protein n=1 Tax=Chamaesiphon polymorphus CCALA 037 TaxID=2107692 RepID=A0A2T1GFX5_9CYAN|nr:hypothetical protein [Chamaesiphon polymorphus]PSB56470.1 hypothetical protein C7B77_11795 [Chamaesiphon polymorphus CCALA 037]
MDPITITLVSWFVGALTGATVTAFWDDIKSWFVSAIKSILDSINRAVEITSDATTYLLKEGGRFYKRVEVYVRNINTEKTVVKYQVEEVSSVPKEIEDQFKNKTKLKISTYST